MLLPAWSSVKGLLRRRAAIGGNRIGIDPAPIIAPGTQAQTFAVLDVRQKRWIRARPAPL
jgi:hypothetical protein